MEWAAHQAGSHAALLLLCTAPSTCMHAFTLAPCSACFSFCLTSPSCMHAAQHQAPSSLGWRPPLELQLQLLVLLAQCPQLQLHLLILLHQGCLQQTALPPLQPLMKAAQGCVQLLVGGHTQDHTLACCSVESMTTQELASKQRFHDGQCVAT